jgi:hypothetical protein
MFLTLDRELYQKIYASNMNFIGVPCIGCTFPATLLCIKIAVEKNVPLLIHGRTRSQLFKELTEGSIDPFLQVTFGNLKPYNAQENKKTIVKYVARLQKLLEDFIPDRTLQKRVKEIFHLDIDKLRQTSDAPEFVGFFVYHPYQEFQVREVIEQEFNWERPQTNQILTH